MRAFDGRMVRGAIAVAALMGATVAVPATVSAQRPRCFGERATIVVTEPGEVTRGTRGADVIVGTAGADNIRGLGGNDRICGLGGADIIRGNAGRDRIKAGTGNDRVIGGKGADLIVGGSGHDTLRGNSGNDTIEGNKGRDEISGGKGHDTINGGAKNDTIFGDAGRDEISGGKGDDTINGGTKDDVIFGNGGRDEISGGKGDDTITGGKARDVLRGNSGNDTIHARDGVAEIVDGGTGSGDVATVDESDTVRNVETVARPGDRAAAIDAYVLGLDYQPEQLMGVVRDGTRVTQPDYDRTLGPDSVIVTTYKHVNLRKNLEDLALMRPSGGVIYPGALVIADRQLAHGQPKPLIVDRAPLTISIDLPGMATSSRRVQDLSHSSVQDAVTSLTSEWINTAYREGYVNADRSSLVVENAYTKEQIALKLDVAVEWLSGSVDTLTEIESTSESTSAVASYRQVFYTVTVDNPGRPSDLFGDQVTAGSLAKLVDEKTPPAYVRSVDYGRMVMVKMETSEVSNSEHVQTSLDQVMWGVDTNTEVDFDHEELVRTSRFSVVSIGGGAQIGATFTGEREGPNGLDAMKEYIRNGAVFRADNPGAPIAYTVAFVQDNAIAKMGFTTDYVLAETEVYPHGYLQVWNAGAFVARFFLSYDEKVDREWVDTDNDGQVGDGELVDVWERREFESGSQAIGSGESWQSIPGDARNVRVIGDVNQVFGWAKVLDRTSAGPPNLCFRLSGDLLFTGVSVSERDSCF